MLQDAFTYLNNKTLLTCVENIELLCIMGKQSYRMKINALSG